ncbi:MAG: M1 family metallopeptidase [Ginsengibacter sp.]
MIKRLPVIFILIFSSWYVTSQSLYMPRDIKKAYQHQTRSNDGNPGLKYWQNTARYDIKISAFPPSRLITGWEKIIYTNNSPDTLRSLVIKLIQNIHKAGAPRFGEAPENYLTEGVFIDSFSINGLMKRPGINQPSSTVQPVRLSKPLATHDRVELFFAWHYQLSLKSGREGMIDSTTYFLAYFYPRVAVYDDYNGWDRLTFNDALEFYNDFNDYTLSVTVPKNYIVWATGDLQNASEVLNPEFIRRLEQSKKSDVTMHIVTTADIAGKNITTQNSINTWKFNYNDISDVAVGLSDHYVWDGAGAQVDDRSGRRASIQAAFNDTAKDFHHMVDYGRNSLVWLSHNFPGVPYPFPKMTVFQGYAGMEYPMMANDETNADFSFSHFVAEHEISHTWFPFYMGINETRYGFMDEGWATAFELLYNRSVMSGDSADEFYRQFRLNDWINDPSANKDLPIITPGENLGQEALGDNEYGKPSLAYLAVKDLLGDELFKKCLLAFMESWHSKHPIPWDFFNSFNQTSGINLNWFWNNWFFTNNYTDIGIQNITTNKQGALVEIRNIGGFAVPIDLQVTFTDGSIKSIHKSPAIWEQNQKQVTISVSGTKVFRSAQILSGIFVDADEGNNTWKK